MCSDTAAPKVTGDVIWHKEIDDLLRESDERERAARANAWLLALREAAGRTGLSETEVAQRLNIKAVELAAAPVGVRVFGRNLRSALTTGVRNQFQTGTSAGVYKPYRRVDVEYMLLGVSPSVSAELRPRYGYLMLEGLDESALDDYGEVTLILNDSVKSRARFCAGDSYQETHMTTPSAFSNPSGQALLSQWSRHPLDTDYARLPYCEVQVVDGGGAIAAEDIAAVVAPGRYRAMVEAAGIVWRPRSRR